LSGTGRPDRAGLVGDEVCIPVRGILPPAGIAWEDHGDSPIFGPILTSVFCRVIRKCRRGMAQNPSAVSPSPGVKSGYDTARHVH